MRSTAKRPGGFSLLEVLVAFVVLSLVATAVFRLFSGALGNASAAEEYSRAVLVAQSALDETAAASPLREGTRAGSADDGRIQWTVQVTPYDAPGIAPELEAASAALPVRMFRIVSAVRFPAPNGGERNLALSTIRVGPRETQ